jgi:hypothetical protein
MEIAALKVKTNRNIVYMMGATSSSILPSYANISYYFTENIYERHKRSLGVNMSVLKMFNNKLLNSGNIVKHTFIPFQ